VDEPGPVGGAEGGQHRLQDVERGAGPQGAALTQDVTQGAARDVLHGEVHIRAVGALVVHAHHVGVVEAGDGLGLTDEALDEFVVGGKAGVHHLDGQHTVQAGVHGSVDRRHAADRDACLDAVAGVERLPDKRIMRGRIHDSAVYESSLKAPAPRPDCGGPVLRRNLPVTVQRARPDGLKK
jgi:hypothetical protein